MAGITKVEDWRLIEEQSPRVVLAAATIHEQARISGRFQRRHPRRWVGRDRLPRLALRAALGASFTAAQDTEAFAHLSAFCEFSELF